MSAPRPRPQAYIWTTWIAPILAGSNSCIWSAWFRAHYFYQRRTSFNQPDWAAEHDSMVAFSRDELVADGFTVTGEDRNKFTLTSGNISLAGKPDLVAVNVDRALVVDRKTGCPRAAHNYQVMLYMVVLPCVRPELSGLRIEGLLQYADDDVMIPAEAVGDEFRQLLRTTVHTVGGPTPPARVPSAQECMFCPIGGSECPERIESDQQPVYDHDLF